MSRAGPEWFDQVVVATHSDQALRMLSDPDRAETAVLGAIRYQPNRATLHTDTRLLPRRRRAWASWNYHRLQADSDRATLTYHLNQLQSIPSTTPVLVTLNQDEAIDPALVLARMDYAHPVLDPATVVAQRRRPAISGIRRTWYCGAYWGYGFHEDGVRSAVEVCRDIWGTAVTTGLPVRPAPIGPRGQDLRSAIYQGTLRHRRFGPGPDTTSPMTWPCLCSTWPRSTPSWPLHRLWSARPRPRCGFAGPTSWAPRPCPWTSPSGTWWPSGPGTAPPAPSPSGQSAPWGWLFNPISLYYCREGGAGVETLVVEVENTPGTSAAATLSVDRVPIASPKPCMSRLSSRPLGSTTSCATRRRLNASTSASTSSRVMTGCSAPRSLCGAGPSTPVSSAVCCGRRPGRPHARSRPASTPRRPACAGPGPRSIAIRAARPTGHERPVGRGPARAGGAGRDRAPFRLDRPRRLLRAALDRGADGVVEVSEEGRTRRLGTGEPVVRVTVHDRRAYGAVLRSGSVGLGASYVAGWWEADDLTALVRVLFRRTAGLRRPLDAAGTGHRWPARSDRALARSGPDRGRSNVRAHYDLSNEFFDAHAGRDHDLFLCPVREPRRSLWATPRRPRWIACARNSSCGPADRLVEIGSGWGAMALHAATHYGCRVTTTTISEAQRSYVSKRIADAGLSHRVTVLGCDWRDLRGRFDNWFRWR